MLNRHDREQLTFFGGRYVVRFVLVVLALAAMMWVEEAPAQQPQPPAKDHPSFPYSIDPINGTPLEWNEVGRVQGDLTGDGQPDLVQAWNVREIVGLGQDIRRPDYSGVWATYSEDIVYQGEVAQAAGERQGPFPDGWVLHFVVPMDEPDDLKVVLEDLGMPNNQATHDLSWGPGVPASQLPPLPPPPPPKVVQWNHNVPDGPVTIELREEDGVTVIAGQSYVRPNVVDHCGTPPGFDNAQDWRRCGDAGTVWLSASHSGWARVFVCTSGGQCTQHTSPDGNGYINF